MWHATDFRLAFLCTPGAMVYSCFGASFFVSVARALMFVPSLDFAKSTIDSKDVAQYLVSPLTAGSSHSLIVFIIVWASRELGSIEKCFRVSEILAEENGMASTTLRGRNLGPDLELGKNMLNFVPVRDNRNMLRN